MENNIKMPASFTEVSKEEMLYTEGGAVTLRVSRAGVAVARRMSAADFGRAIVGMAGLDIKSAVGRNLYNMVASSYKSIVSTAGAKTKKYNVPVARNLSF